jgi:salicylate hydroxylase
VTLRAIVVGGGIGGTAAALVAEPAEPVFSGVVAYRGLVPCPDGYPADAIRMWLGEGKHFPVFPMRPGGC